MRKNVNDEIFGAIVFKGNRELFTELVEQLKYIEGLSIVFVRTSSRYLWIHSLAPKEGKNNGKTKKI